MSSNRVKYAFEMDVEQSFILVDCIQEQILACQERRLFSDNEDEKRWFAAHEEYLKGIRTIVLDGQTQIE